MDEPIIITGRTVTKAKISTSVGVVLIIVTLPLIVLLAGFHPRDVAIGAAFLAMPLTGLTAIRAAASQFAKLVFQLAPIPVPDRSWFQASVGVSRETIRKWTPTFWILLFLWGIGLLGPVLIGETIVVGCACLAVVWAQTPMVTAIDTRKMSQEEVDAWHRPSARVRRGANLLLSQWFAGISMGLAVALIVFTVAAITAPARLHLWRWALLFAFAYLIVGSLLRAAAETTNRLWIDIDVVRLWNVSRRTSLRAATVAGVGAAIGALVGCGIWLTGHLGADGQALDMAGRWVTAGTVLGAAAGVLIAPRLAFIRRRELRQDDRNWQRDQAERGTLT